MLSTKMKFSMSVELVTRDIDFHYSCAGVYCMVYSIHLELSRTRCGVAYRLKTGIKVYAISSKHVSTKGHEVDFPFG